MIKLIKALWKKLFGKKEKITPSRPDHCETHSRYKKSCPSCQQIALG